MNEIGRFIYEKTVEFLQNGDHSNIIFKTFPGSGKTTMVMMAADSIGANWIYVAPSHDIIEENIKHSSKRSYDYIHLKSKAKVCANPDAHALFSRGYDADFMCRKCNFRPTCEYMEMQRIAHEMNPSIGIVHAHLHTWLPKFLKGAGVLDNYDVLIIDENPINYMFRQEFLTHAQLSSLRGNMLLVRDMDTALYDFIGALQQNPIDYKKLGEYAGMTYSGTDRFKFVERYTRSIYDRYSTRYSMARLPRNLLGLMYEAIDNANDLRYAFKWSRDGKMIVSVLYNDAISSLGLPVIGLDGTASYELWSNILGSEDVKIYTADYYYGKAYQLIGPRLPITTWRRSQNVRIKYTELIRKIASTTDRGVLVIATKYIIDNILKPMLSDVENLVYAHYYNLRSKNSFYMKCDTVVLACEPNPHSVTYEAAIRLSGWGEGLWKRIYTIDEMRQAVGRLRGNIKELPDGTQREDIRVFILPSTGVTPSGASTILNEALVVSYDTLWDMLDGKAYTGDLEIMKMLLDEMPISMIAFSQKYNISYSKIRRLMKKLVMMGYVTKEGNRYRKTERAPEAFDSIRMG